MDLLILEYRPKNDSAYRGTYRAPPSYVDEVDRQHSVNQAFIWYSQEGYRDGAVHDLEKARKLVEEYRRLEPPRLFEIVAVTRNEELPRIRSQFLGYDISAGYYYSLLSWGLRYDREPPATMKEDDAYHILRPLLRLAQAHFRPQLNSNGLFVSYDTAQFCLDCLMALQEIRPGLWENEEVEFEVVGLWRMV